MNVKIDIAYTILYTERLILRAWKSDYLDDLYEYASAKDEGSMTGLKKL